MRTVHKEILKSLLPAIIFMVIFKTYSYKAALVVGFGIGLIVYYMSYKKRGKLTTMDKLGVFGLIVQSILGAMATNPKVYFIYPLIENIAFALVFFGSLFIGKEIVGIFASDYEGGEASYSLLKPTYRLLTGLWAGYFALKALIKVVGLMNWSFELLYTVNWLLGTPCAIILMWLSFTYPNKVYDRLVANGSYKVEVD